MSKVYKVYAERDTYKVLITKDAINPNDDDKIVLKEGLTKYSAELVKEFYEKSYEIHGDFVEYY